MERIVTGVAQGADVGASCWQQGAIRKIRGSCACWDLGYEGIKKLHLIQWHRLLSLKGCEGRFMFIIRKKAGNISE